MTIALRHLKSLCVPHERRCILAKILMIRRFIVSAVLPACIAFQLAAMPISSSESPSGRTLDTYHAYDSGLKKSQLMLAADMIVFF